MKQKRNLFILFIVLPFLLETCILKNNVPKDINGLWKMQGYGKIIEITDSIIFTYDYTEISCILNSKIKRDEIYKLGNLELISHDSMIQTRGTKYYLNRIHELPKEHLTVDTIALKAPIYNFDVFWQTLNDNYPFFKIRNVDWIEIKNQYRKRVTVNTSEEELFYIIKEITEKLGDGHTNISASNRLNEKWESDKINSISDSLQVSGIDIKSLENAIVERYIKTPKVYGKDLYGKGLVNWGLIRDNVGYIQINNMMFFGNYNLPDSLNGYDYLFAYLDKSESNPNYQQNEISGIKNIMDSIITDLKNIDAIILDIRFNLGGEDLVSLEILRHFIQKETLLYSKKAKCKTSFTKSQQFSIIPSDKTFIKPVYLLTSYQTASASEVFAMSSLVLNNITRIGSPTQGVFSDVLMKKLPNGWDLYLSNEVYETFDGQILEKIGVKPNFLLDYPKDENKFIYYIYNNLKDGDKAIEFALKLIDNKQTE